MNISDVQKLVENDGIIFLSYGGFLSQTLIAGMTEALEKEAVVNDIGIGISSNIFTIFIEMSQNMMNYSKSTEESSNDIIPGGLIIVSKDSDGNYTIDSQNSVSLRDKEKIDALLLNIQKLDKDTIRKSYKELRRSGKNKHEKGGGLGFYEIAKRCDEIEYSFESINSDKFYFHMKTIINIKK